MSNGAPFQSRNFKELTQIELQQFILIENLSHIARNPCFIGNGETITLMYRLDETYLFFY